MREHTDASSLHFLWTLLQLLRFEPRTESTTSNLFARVTVPQTHQTSALRWKNMSVREYTA
jgi:hypothetical protein